MKAIPITLFVVILLQQLLSASTTKKTGTPEYVVLEKIGLVEIRSYPGLVLASAHIGTNSSGNGFRTIAGYIFGDNNTGEKISMTSPVMIEMGDTMRMSFIMPQEYSLNTLPDPNHKDVYLHEEQATILAVIEYGGFSSDIRFEEHKEQLKAILEKNNISVSGPFMFLGYNPPYELINRRNEVAVKVIWPK